MKKLFCAITLLCLTVLISIEVSAEVCDGYEWGSVSLGGGGYVTGMASHDDGTVYVRTDVAGVFKKNGDRWQSLMEWITPAEKNLFGADGIAVDPKNSDIVYAALGKYINQSPCGVYKTTNGGKTWSDTGLNTIFGSNTADRMKGECIAIDPYCSDIVYVLTRDNHLYKSSNAGESWEDMVSFPAFSLGKYGRSIEFDKNSVSDGKARIVYADIQGVGVYRSDNFGDTWELIGGENAPTEVYRMRVDSNGNLLVAAGNGLLKYSNNTWTVINSYSLYGETAFRAVDVDNANPNRIIAVYSCGVAKKEFENVIFYTEDGGNTWKTVNEHMTKTSTVPWWLSYYFSAHTSDIHFKNDNEVWLTDWYGTWNTLDITADVSEWVNNVKGIENMVAFDMACPSTGAPLIVGMADVSGMRVTDIGLYPNDVLRNPLKPITCSIDFCESDPNTVARIATAGDGDGAIGISHDNGETYSQKVPFQFAGGRIAVSCGGGENTSMVMVPVNGAPWYSADGGETWQMSDFPQGDDVDFVLKVWSWNECLKSDRKKPDTFYLCNAYNGKLYVSEDGGASWTMRVQNQPKYAMQIETAPDMEGHIWMSMGNLGLELSTDGGYSFDNINNVQNALQCSLGKAREGSSYPTVYVFGTVNDEDGVFRTTDYGCTWDKISNTTTELGADVNCMEADRQTFGTVYLGTNGRSIYFGRENVLHTFFDETRANNFIGHMQMKYNDTEYKECVSDDVSVSGDNSYCFKASKTNMRYKGWDKDSSGNLQSIGDISESVASAISNQTAYICGWFYASGGSKTKTVRLLYGDTPSNQRSENIKLPNDKWVYLSEKITDPTVKIGVVDTGDDGAVYVDDFKIISVPIGEDIKIPDRVSQEGPGKNPTRYMRTLKELYSDDVKNAWTNNGSSAIKEYIQKDSEKAKQGRYSLKFLGTLLMGYTDDNNQQCTLGEINDEITSLIKSGNAYISAWVYVNTGDTTDGAVPDFFIPTNLRVRGEWKWICRKLNESDIAEKNLYIKSNNLYTWIDDVRIVTFPDVDSDCKIEYYSLEDNSEYVTLSTSLFNNTLSGKNLSVIFSTKDENGILKSIKTDTVKSFPNRPCEIFNEYERSQSNDTVANVMIWDGTDGMNPLIDAESIDLK